MLIFWQFGLYRGIWRYASTTDLRRIVLAVMLSAAAIPLLFWMLRLGLVVPRSVLVINPLLLILLMGAVVLVIVLAVLLPIIEINQLVR